MDKSDVQFKATPEWFKAIVIDLKNWPTLPEALKAKKEADIVGEQGIKLFLSKPVRWVLKELERRHDGEYSDLFKRIDAFNYGYIFLSLDRFCGICISYRINKSPRIPSLTVKLSCNGFIFNYSGSPSI